jgi:hypothetical protein
MADLAASAVSLTPSTDLSASEFYQEGRSYFTRRIKLTSVSVGGATNRITASALGFNKLIDCGSSFDSTNNKIIPAAVDPINNIILLGAGSSLAVGDLSSVTGYIVVTGF